MREMSAVERSILDRLLSVDFEDAAGLRAQMAHVLGAEPNCPCGCPSITPLIDRSAVSGAVTPWTMLPVELEEIDGPGAGARRVLLFTDTDGYLANLECSYYDESRDEWPDPSGCVVLIRDTGGYLTAVGLPSGLVVRPKDPADAWVSVEPSPAGGLTGTTFSGYREEFGPDGCLIDRRFVK
jgi:hypothetical protein